MLPVISEPRPEISPNAPKMIKMKIPTDMIRSVIGSGGKVIQKIQADSGAKIDIEETGEIFISAPDTASCELAKKAIDTIVFVPEVGSLYYGKVVRILKFGAFVELAPGKDGMVHISKLSDKRVAKVEDVVNIGDEVTVRVVEVDRMGRINLTMRPEDMTADLEKLTRPERRERSDRPERRDDRRGGRRDDRRERSEKKEDNE